MFRRTGMLLVGLVFVITLIPFAAQGTDPLSNKGESTEPDRVAKIRVVEGYGKLPLHFEANQGQVDQRVRFLSRGSGYNLLLTSNEAVLTLSRRENDNNRNRATERNSRERDGESLIQTGTLWMRWEGANQEAKIEGVEGLDGKSHYFIGNDPEKWRRNISLYRKVRYRDLYPGVDLIYYGNQRQLEYDLIVMPQGDPNAIRLAIEGAEEVRVNEGGDLVVRISGGEVIQHKPLIYQETEGKREIIRGGYVVDSLGKQDEKAKVRISFKIDHFDREKPLVIDPYLVYSTYLGGSSTDTANGIAVDDSGSAYIAGMTLSPNFPTINPFQGFRKGNADAFVTKLNPSGTALVYSTYLGGANSLNATNDAASGIAVDSSGSAYITGNTCSTDFPTLNPIQAVYGGGITDGFVTKLNPSGSALVYSTYLGGNGENDYGSGIVVDSSGNAYITGVTKSTNFPTLNPIQPSNAGGSDAFVTKLSSSGALVYSTYLGGSYSDGGYSIAVDSSGSAYVTGSTYSPNFPTMNPIQASLGGLDSDAFITKLNPSGTALVYSTFLGGTYGPDYDIDYGMGIAVDDSGSAYVVGSTWCSNFPTVNPIQGSYAGSRDLFIAKVNPAGTALVYSTYLGGSNNDEGNGIALDGTGSAYITGYTSSTNFPTSNAIQGTHGGGSWDAFVTKLNPSGSALVCSTYLGGNGDDFAQWIAVDSAGSAYITGFTGSTNFPTLNPFQGSYAAGGYDAFVTKVQIKPRMIDFNADGLSDLAGLTSVGTIYNTTNLSNWTQIPGLLNQMVVGDFDGDGRSDLAGLASNGTIWYTTNLSTWTNIPGILAQLVSGDFNPAREGDELAGLASNGSIWVTNDLSTWINIPGALDQLVVGDFNGDGTSDLAGLTLNGTIWYTTNLSTWTNIPEEILAQLVSGDFNPARVGDELAGLTSNGTIWYTTNLSTWTNIPGTLGQLVSGNFNPVRTGDELAGLASDGSIWVTANLSTWTNIPGTLGQLVSGNFNPVRTGDELAGLASDGSIWVTTNLSTWTQVPGALSELAE